MSFNNCIIWNNIASANSWKGGKRRGEDEEEVEAEVGEDEEEERTCSELMDVPWMCNVIILVKRSGECMGGRGGKKMKWMDE